ncbi:MAG: DUF475 domain-containing protein [Lactococcus cremoris]|jgi:hypothetical protein|uniref:Membrane protein n=1 Tax=Lactococcus cremoris subsp. cremoris IBB477 TaxID=1449093 RepID=A0A1E7G3S3_LACLC|nr:DUF475 domain-containing protein [Lactococcus cremoris]MCI1840631.1 DUF475 domain-containing protein [Lactococcus lactis]KZK07146.1 Integral membrane protein [Lactococcus cremoris]MCT0456480.1 DUF475 domain-containing protein [Lactococcus cremoris]MCT0474570.1 DUF475 domain-containing protein [Lactococcus cremoris]MCT0477661.1 DUF475 domain-containing protein [Lactococcus cremoris]
MKIFRGSIIVSLIALIIAFIYGGWNGLFITLILAVLEISLSMDNAIVNARILERMSPAWQKTFLTLGVLIAVVGMRFVFPLLIVGVSAQIDPISALRLALEKGNPSTAGTYGYILHHAHPQIAAFGGMFLLMLALGFFFDERAHTWLKLPEKFLQKIGHFPAANAIISIIILLITSEFIAKESHAVLFAGILGILTFMLVDGFGETMSHSKAATSTDFVVATGKAGLALFLYLEVIDASFSFDGVIGAFAITADPIIILLGLGVIGAMFVRSLTLYLVQKGTLNDLVYLEHGAHWAILTLAFLILVSIKWEIGEVVTGLTGAILIILSFVSSVIYNRNH